jgi:hypothetical protein
MVESEPYPKQGPGYRLENSGLEYDSQDSLPNHLGSKIRKLRLLGRAGTPTGIKRDYLSH